jgi:hypothetical protein
MNQAHRTALAKLPDVVDWLMGALGAAGARAGGGGADADGGSDGCAGGLLCGAAWAGRALQPLGAHGRMCPILILLLHDVVFHGKRGWPRPLVCGRVDGQRFVGRVPLLACA